MADAHLEAMRERMAALSQMASVAALQEQLAVNIKSSMARIDKIMDDDSGPSTAAAVDDDDEVEAWRRKIEELSRPTSSRVSTSAGIASASSSALQTDLTPRQLPMSSLLDSSRAAPVADRELSLAPEPDEHEPRAIATEEAAGAVASSKQPSLLRRCASCFLCNRGPRYSSMAVEEEPDDDHVVMQSSAHAINLIHRNPAAAFSI